MTELPLTEDSGHIKAGTRSVRSLVGGLNFLADSTSGADLVAVLASPRSDVLQIDLSSSRCRRGTGLTGAATGNLLGVLDPESQLLVQFVRMRTRYQAERDTDGVYRALLKISSPSLAISRMPTLQAQYLDFPGHGEVEVAEAGRAIMACRQLPLIVSRLASFRSPTAFSVASGMVLTVSRATSSVT